MKHTAFCALSNSQQIALDEAQRALEHAYSPYSHFCVGACLYNLSGLYISGSNFENAAYGSTICAERSAVLRANAMGIRKFCGIAIIARGENFDTTEITGPCGSCRQVLYEVSQISSCDLEVVLATSRKDTVVLTTISELLPLAFGPIDLGVDITRFQK